MPRPFRSFMKMKLPLFLSSLGFVLTLVSCEQCDTPAPFATSTVELRLGLEWNDEPFQVGDNAPDVQGRPVQLERLECYLGEFELLDAEEGWIRVEEAAIARVDFSAEDPMVRLVVPSDRDRTIEGIRMGLGVPAEWNTDVDPASYEDPEHPLGYKGSLGMHWGWAAGYIFSIYEGRLLDDENTPFAYHAGADTCYRQTEVLWDEPWLLPFDGMASPGIVLDAYDCLHGDNDVIDIPTDPESHTGNNLPLALRWVDLYREAWRAAP